MPHHHSGTVVLILVVVVIFAFSLCCVKFCHRNEIIPAIFGIVAILGAIIIAGLILGQGCYMFEMRFSPP